MRFIRFLLASSVTGQTFNSCRVFNSIFIFLIASQYADQGYLHLDTWIAMSIELKLTLSV